MVNCEECSKRPTCIKLCKEAEEYANQDHIKRTEEIRVPDPDIFSNEDAIEWSTLPDPTMIDFTATKFDILSPRQRQVIDLFINYNLTQNQIASTLGLSRIMIRTYYSRALKKLRNR